jgi:hypothetical protein
MISLDHGYEGTFAPSRDTRSVRQVLGYSKHGRLLMWNRRRVEQLSLSSVSLAEESDYRTQTSGLGDDGEQMRHSLSYARYHRTSNAWNHQNTKKWGVCRCSKGLDGVGHDYWSGRGSLRIGSVLVPPHASAINSGHSQAYYIAYCRDNLHRAAEGATYPLRLAKREELGRSTPVPSITITKDTNILVSLVPSSFTA